MIKFFKKKENFTKNSKPIAEIFPWLTTIDEKYLDLCNQDINYRINVQDLYHIIIYREPRLP